MYNEERLIETAGLGHLHALFAQVPVDSTGLIQRIDLVAVNSRAERRDHALAMFRETLGKPSGRQGLRVHTIRVWRSAWSSTANLRRSRNERIIAAIAFSVLVPLVARAQEVDVIARNKEVIRQNLAHICGGDVKAAAADFAENADNFGRPVGREGIQRTLEDILTTFPDYCLRIVEMVAVGDAVIVRCNVTGTHLGMAKRPANGGGLVGVKPEGKRHEITHIHWYTLRDGKIVQHYANRDDLGMMRQLGLAPPVPTASVSPAK